MASTAYMIKSKIQVQLTFVRFSLHNLDSFIPSLWTTLSSWDIPLSLKPSCPLKPSQTHSMLSCVIHSMLARPSVPWGERQCLMWFPATNSACNYRCLGKTYLWNESTDKFWFHPTGSTAFPLYYHFWFERERERDSLLLHAL